MGTLNLFDQVEREWTEAERAGVAAFARVAAILRIALEAYHRGQLIAELSEWLSSDRLAPAGRCGGRA